MDISESTLQDAFARDHRKMTRGFHRLRQSLEGDDWSEVRRIAAEIDDQVGSHIEFEETVYYPRLQPIIGPANTRRMFAEHATGLRLIKEILAADAGPTNDHARWLLIERCNRMLDHAQSCGTLVSHLASLPEEEQRELLEKLETIRDLHHRWSELGDPGAAADPGPEPN